jgi:hypothetical protein
MITRIGTYAQIKGLAYSLPCKVATTGSITLSGTQTIDGVAVVAGERVLVKNQGTASSNGIYTVESGAWVRAIDMSLTDDVYEGIQIYINQGTVNGGNVFYLDTPNPIVLGSTGLSFLKTESGTSGTSGSSGTSGTSGINGTSGTSGTSGTRGTSGTSGTSGTRGTSGTSGTSGSSGSTTITNASDNRVVTSTGGSGLNAEANLTFNGSILTATGTVFLASVSGNVNIGTLTDQGYKLGVVGSIGTTGTITADSNIRAFGQIASNGADKGNSGTAVTFDWNQGNVQTVTMTGNATFTFSSPLKGASYQIIITQDATGGRTITWPTIHWEGKSVPSLTGTANSVDVVTLTYDGAKYLGVMSKNHGTP